MDYNNPEFDFGENKDSQTSGEYNSDSTRYVYGTNGGMNAGGNPDMNPNSNYYAPTKKSETDALAIISLVMGILSLLCCCVGGGVIFGIIGIILAGISIANKKGGGVAIGGLVTSIIGFVFSLIVIIYIALTCSAVIGNPMFKDMMESVQDGTFDYYNDYPFDEDWMKEFY